MFVHFSFGKLLEQEKLLVSKTKVVRRRRSRRNGFEVEVNGREKLCLFVCLYGKLFNMLAYINVHLLCWVFAFMRLF